MRGRWKPARYRLGTRTAGLAGGTGRTAQAGTPRSASSIGTATRAASGSTGTVIPTVSKSELDYLWPINWLGLHQQYLQQGEMDCIAALLRMVEAKSVLEIGCRDGRTARVLLHNVSALQRYIGVDVPMEYVPALAHQRAEMVGNPGNLATADPRFELVIRERGSLDLGPQDLPVVDAAFIDGDHSEKAVAYDSALARAVVRQGGVIIWHDAFNGAVEVVRVLDRLCDEGWPIKVIEGTWLAYQLN